jgi:hypothetical protein
MASNFNYLPYSGVSDNAAACPHAAHRRAMFFSPALAPAAHFD